MARGALPFFLLLGLFLSGIFAANDRPQRESLSTIKGPRVVNGVSVNGPDVYPFMAWLGDDRYGFFCGGALIDPNWILTAAHCLYDSLHENLGIEIQLHRYDYSTPPESEGGVIRGVVNAIRHPQYDPQQLTYDLGLLQLNQSVDTVTPLPLNRKYFDLTNQKARFVGWGSTDVQCHKYSTFLEEGDIEIQSNKTCSRDEGAKNFHTDQQLCAGEQIAQHSWIEAGCGDSGGPLIFDQGNSDFLHVGLVSWGFGYNYDVYTKTYSFIDWIDAQTNSSTAE